LVDGRATTFEVAVPLSSWVVAAAFKADACTDVPAAVEDALAID